MEIFPVARPHWSLNWSLTSNYLRLKGPLNMCMTVICLGLRPIYAPPISDYLVVLHTLACGQLVAPAHSVQQPPHTRQIGVSQAEGLGELPMELGQDQAIGEQAVALGTGQWSVKKQSRPLGSQLARVSVPSDLPGASPIVDDMRYKFPAG